LLSFLFCRAPSSRLASELPQYPSLPASLACHAPEQRLGPA
jgi:hypothetical protein